MSSSAETDVLSITELALTKMAWKDYIFYKFHTSYLNILFYLDSTKKGIIVLPKVQQAINSLTVVTTGYPVKLISM